MPAKGPRIDDLHGFLKLKILISNPRFPLFSLFPVQFIFSHILGPLHYKMLRNKKNPGTLKRDDISGHGGLVKVCLRRIILVEGPRGLPRNEKYSILKYMITLLLKFLILQGVF